MKDKVSVYLYLIFAFIGFDFLKSGYGKFSGGEFVGSLAGTLGKFASKNPYPFMKGFLENVAIPNSVIFGYLTMWGEILTGLNLLVLSTYLIISKKPHPWVYPLLSIGFLAGLSLNTTFWFAAGWTSASTETVNMVMGFVNAVGLVYSVRKSMQG